MWAALVGLLFLNPLLGLATDAALGLGLGPCAVRSRTTALTTTSSDRSARLQRNTSALFVLVRKVQSDKVLPELSKFKGR